MNETEIETAQQRFDRDMAEAHGDPHLMHAAQARHNGRVWGAAMARCTAVQQHVNELERLVATLYARPEPVPSDELRDLLEQFKAVEERLRTLMGHLEAQHAT